jgi:hypothetical protein
MRPFKSMVRGAMSALVVLLAAATAALAGPEGSYDVSGTNPGDGSSYSGRVTVEQTGETYQVIWDVAGTRFIGSGLGAAPVKGNTVMGPAAANDDVLAVGYVSGDRNFGLAFYVEQDDGTWSGIWTFGGSTAIGTEIWTPR